MNLDIDGREPLTAGVVAAIDSLCDAAEDAGPGAGVVVIGLTGAPDPGGPPDLDVALVSRWERALRRLERLDTATVAVVTGDCGGPALETLLATDYRIAREGARLLVPTGRDGAWPGMAVYRLANQLGVAAARRIVLFGPPVPAAEALQLHLIDEVAPDPAARLQERIGSLATRPAVLRRLMLDATTTSFEEALGSHLAACDRALRGAAGALS